jgi:outer membrane receptor protein involved in Fe transport
LEVGALPTINFTLKVGAAVTEVEVSSDAAIVDVTQSKVQTSVTREVLNEIPKGRSFQSVIPFAPGARQEPLQSRREDNGRANGFQIDGASDSENVYLIEGLNTTNIQDGGVGRNVPTEFVQEVQVKSSSFEAEFGGALGGVVNVVQRRGSNAWHGSVFTYYRSSAFDANDQCQTPGFTNTTCGLRTDPSTSSNSGTRTDGVPQYYLQKQDHYRFVDPGFEVGGPLLKDRIWLFTSYVPSLVRYNRTVNFTGVNPGPRNFERTIDQQNALTRIDYRVASSLNVFGAWQYGYSKTTGSLPNPDSLSGQTNTGAGTDPTSIRQDRGTVNPSSVYNFGADWTPTSHMVVTGRYGYFFNNNEDRGTAVGLRYLYSGTANSGTTVFGGSGTNQVPTAFQHTTGFNNISSNQSVLYDAYKRKAYSVDASFFKGNFWGTHNFKWGYSNNKTSNDTTSGFNQSEVDVYYGQDYTPGTSATACDAVIAQNTTTYGAAIAGNHCRGSFGYFIVHDGVDTIGHVSANNHALYVQDGWTVGHGLTLNLGIRFDKEFLPPYAAGADSINFGFGDKIAPRIGGAYDLLHNGKVKLYASYGKFFDIMKFGLPRGSFGGDYWHDCAYAMDFADYTTITPTAPVALPGPENHGCPVTGPAPGVTVGRFIENQDLRLNILTPGDPGVDPNIKPMEQHEFVAGTDWAINPKLGLEVRYSRKRLDRTIEDMGVSDSLGFYIGNPGPSAFGNLLKRPLLGSGLTSALCPTCPDAQEARRNYDGVEFRLTKQASDKWFGSVSYTYSKLTGNYSGLTDTDVSDGNGGRHSPSNGRAFDQQQMQWDAHGNPSDGPLPTDRPHALKAFGYYNMKWFGGETRIGMDQAIFSGTPLSTCWPTLTSASSCQFVEGRGKWVDVTRTPGAYNPPDPANPGFGAVPALPICVTCGNYVQGAIYDRRTPIYTQSDLNFSHEIKVSKTNEALRLAFGMNVQNLFNQHAVVSVQNNPMLSGAVAPTTPKTASNPTGFNFNALETGWNYIAQSNTQLRTVRAAYGLPNLFQQSRQLRFQVKFAF